MKIRIYQLLFALFAIFVASAWACCSPCSRCCPRCPWSNCCLGCRLSKCCLSECCTMSRCGRYHWPPKPPAPIDKFERRSRKRTLKFWKQRRKFTGPIFGKSCERPGRWN